MKNAINYKLCDQIAARMMKIDAIPDTIEDMTHMMDCMWSGHVIITGNRRNRWIAAAPDANWHKIVKDLKEIVR